MMLSIYLDGLTLKSLATLLNGLTDNGMRGLPITLRDGERLVKLQQQLRSFASIADPPDVDHVDVCETSTEQVTDAELEHLFDDGAETSEDLDALNQATGFAPFDDGGPTAHDVGRVCRWCGTGENLNPTGTWCHDCDRSNIEPDQYHPRKGR
mgnify:CR=1 FL=1